MARIELELLDGRVIDLSDLSAEELVARVRAEGITAEMVKETRHFIEPGALASITCPRCGATSYNRNDIEQRYCGACHLFHAQLGEHPDYR
jgi:ribosomal protein L37E